MLVRLATYLITTLTEYFHSQTCWHQICCSLIDALQVALFRLAWLLRSMNEGGRSRSVVYRGFKI